MKIQNIIFALCAFFLTSCTAQKVTFTISNTVKGNTGHRGMIPQDEAYKPIEGKDYFNMTLTITSDCTLEIVDLTVKEDGGQVKLMPKFEDKTIKKRFKKGETVFLHVEKEKDMTVAKPNISGEGSLSIKINGKWKQIQIKEFTMIYPM